MTYDQAIDVMRRHQGHGEALVCLLSQDAGMSRSSPTSELAYEAAEYLKRRYIHLAKLGYPAHVLAEINRTEVWFRNFAATEKGERHE